VTGVSEAMAEPCLPFFIERDAQRAASHDSAIDWLELAGDAGRIERWVAGGELVLRVVGGAPRVRAIAVGGRELRTA
jgi:hypothetical protein